MTAPNPTVLSHSTRLAPIAIRSRSQSPSRSPVRKAQFAARELDPLLANLSPDSTLKALQATDTIRSEGHGQDALARTIAEASPAEREIGIRAAVAAQKVKQWHQEISQWSWPSRRDRGWGAGFLPPQTPSGQPAAIANEAYLGCLPSSSVVTYQARIEDIRDGLEALDLEEIKDHVFSSHVPQRSVSAPYALETSPDIRSTGYGRMRDFTALITATVIQALPELANLTILLDTWDVRLSVLRQIPEITQMFRVTRSGVQTAFQVVRGPETGSLVTMEECDATKNILGGKVALLGSKIDKLLDLLEGHEDSLPKYWIDTLENVENEYAAWVVEAEHIAIRNSLLAKALARPPSHEAEESRQTKGVVADESAPVAKLIEPAQVISATPPMLRSADAGQQTLEEPSVGTPLAELPPSDFFRRSSPVRKPLPNSSLSQNAPLTISVPKQGHNRGVSEVSLANSTFSAMSDLSNAEIVDAKSTQVLMSPKINVVDNPLRASRDELSWLTAPPLDLNHNASFRPPMIQRASTASIEMISRNSIKQVNLTRSRSHDMLGSMPPPVPSASTPSEALRQLSGTVARPVARDARIQNEPDAVLLGESATFVNTPSSGVSPTPSLQVKPLRVRSRNNSGIDFESPALPRRSSKRVSQTFDDALEDYDPTTSMRSVEESPDFLSNTTLSAQAGMGDADGSLEARIQNILSTMPNRIRLASEDEIDDVQQPRSTVSSRCSTPMPTFTLSPVKTDHVHRQNASGDIRLFHLTKAGQARDAPPAKLFVRTVGERVMVRVGGGWADLAEYLREYSLHHRHRGLENGSLEVASFPSAQAGPVARSAVPVSTTNVGNIQSKSSEIPLSASSKRRSLPSTLDTNDLPPLNINKSRKGIRENGSSTLNSNLANGWTMPPVPPIPSTYTMQSPTMVTTTAGGITNTSTIPPLHLGLQGNQRAVSAPLSGSNTTDGRLRSTVTTISNQSTSNNSYTPLGAAGPKANGRRAMTPNRPTSATRESWVDGMVGRARALSSGTTVIHGPTTTTTTTVISRTMPINNSRRASAFANLSPAKTPTPTTTTRTTSSPANSEPKAEATPSRTKNRMSFGDVSGIRRVFLRKKSDK